MKKIYKRCDNNFFNFSKGIIKKFLLLLFILFFNFLFFGCGPSAGYFNLVQSDVELKPITKENNFSEGKTATVSEFSLKESAKILKVDYDDSIKSVLIKYSDNDEYYIMILNLMENKIKWCAKSNLNFSLMQNNNLILYDGIGSRLYDSQTGQFIRDIEPSLFLIGDGRTLQLNSEKFAQIDIRTGRISWETEGASWKGFREEYFDGDYCFVVAEGLHAIKLDEGKKWEYLTSTSFTNVGKELAQAVALACIGVSKPYNPDVTMNMNSAPLIINDEIYFAARDKIVCLNKLTGKIIWENTIDPELESMSLYNISENEIALVGNGTRIVNKVLRESDPPTIRIIQKKDGKITGLYSMDKPALVQSFLIKEDNFYLLTSNQLLILNKDLKLVSIFETNVEYGNFTHFLSIKDTIVMRTTNGLVGISKTSLSETFFKYCRFSNSDVENVFTRPYFLKNDIGKRNLLQSGIFWTPNESNGITAFNTENWKEIATFSLFSKNLMLYDEKYIDFSDNKLKIISIK